MEMDIKSWASAQEIIKKCAENQALKTDHVKSAPKAQGQMLLKLSGVEQSPTQRPSSQSPGRERRKPDVGSQRQSSKRARGGEGKKGGRSPSNSRECCGWNEIVTGDHYSNNCPKKKKEEPGRSITPYPRGRNPSKERGSQSKRRDLQNVEGILWMQTVGQKGIQE